MEVYLIKTIAMLLSSYILGSVPFGLIIVRACKGIDIRNVGSGNIGATNVLRAAGPGLAIIVFAADIGKGIIPIIVAKQLLPDTSWVTVAVGMAAILGHGASIFLRFKGGKGVATSLGVIIGLDPRIAGIGFLIWLIVVGITKYVSLASIISAIGIAVLMHTFRLPFAYQVFAALAGAFVIAKHKSNIVRLIQGKESRIGQKVNTTEG